MMAKVMKGTVCDSRACVSVLTLGCGCSAVSDTNDLHFFRNVRFRYKMTCAVFRKHVFRYKKRKYNKINKLQKIKKTLFYTKRTPRQRYQTRIRNFRFPRQRFKTRIRSNWPPVPLFVSLRLRTSQVLPPRSCRVKWDIMVYTGQKTWKTYGNARTHGEQRERVKKKRETEGQTTDREQKDKKDGVVICATPECPSTGPSSIQPPLLLLLSPRQRYCNAKYEEPVALEKLPYAV